MKSSRSVLRPVVTTDGANLVSHAGLGLVGELADRAGVTGGLSELFARCGHRWRVHEPGVTLVGIAAAIAGGARRVAGVDAVRQSALFPRVGSYSTIWRTIYRAGGDRELHGIAQVLAEARERVWAHVPAGRLPDGLTIDVDSTLVNVHSDKERAASTYKRGFGMHPIGAWCDDTNEPLAAIMRPGNAGANSAVDHIDVIDAALDALPARYRRGHRVGDERCEAVHPILVRADSAGATHLFLAHLRDRNVGFSVGYHITAAVQAALNKVSENDWIAATEKDGAARDGAQVVELTGSVPLDAWPAGTRLIVRRERPHPGAQLSLFDHLSGWRHTAFLTDSCG
ncbi:MAG: IS1380 family transposase, partial [Actinomycetota bacterium]|nr:IS1380 family transposase [Actinomycetota bacterium]